MEEAVISPLCSDDCENRGMHTANCEYHYHNSMLLRNGIFFTAPRSQETYHRDNRKECTISSFGNNPIVLKQTTPIRFLRISRVGVLLLCIQTEKHLQRRSLQQGIVRLKLKELKNGIYKAASKRETLKCTTQVIRRYVNRGRDSHVHHVPQTTHQRVHLRFVEQVTQLFTRKSIHHTHHTSSLETTHTEHSIFNLLEGEGGMERRQQLQLLLLIQLLLIQLLLLLQLLKLQTPCQTTPQHGKGIIPSVVSHQKQTPTGPPQLLWRVRSGHHL